ncbi:hemicentin-2-like [Siniperca chuatsi]|uniref:hemicentin-2-like n=1 Tax=Siniperca chuatsi TaxID=119488 RepID=UPI001CE20FB9|nr:hemicentin-2-like [Siniperca chuatsi]
MICFSCGNYENMTQVHSHTVGVHASCPIELSSASVVVRYGDPVSVNCSTSESLFEGMGWEAPQGGTGIEKVNHLSWTVPRLTEWDISPSCYINPSPINTFKQCFLSLKVILYTFPETISINSSSGSDGVMNESEQYNFTCDIPKIAPVQNLTVKWYKGDKIVYTDTFDNPSKKPVNQSSVFSFTPTRQDDGVAFRCEAHLDLEEQHIVSSQEYNITINFGPDVQCSSPEVLEGEPLEKLCSVTGSPTQFVRWLKDGQPTDPTVPLSRENAGLYTIEAGGLSFTQKELWVLVLYGPELMCPSNYTALEYAPHNLTCTVEGYPKPETIWYKDGEEVELPENLTRSDTGQYLITASNNLSTVSLKVEINVIYPPSQIVELEDSEVDVGSSMWLKCSSTGNPRPKYFWNYYRTANVMEENEDGVSRLLIHNATAYNMGSYTCHAWNDRGNVSKTARVTVKGANQECPIEITPDRMVIQYQNAGHHATCKTGSINSSNIEEDVYWQVLPGIKINSTNLFVDAHKDWDIKPVCTATFKGIGTCKKYLNVTLYKTPDSVSIRHVDKVSSVVEEREFQLQCDITNVAPAQNLTVRWYQGNETIKPLIKGSMQVSGCLPENSTNCNLTVIRSPVNVSSTVSITLNRKHNGAEFRCEALLDFGPEGPQPPPNTMSSPLNITVYYKPIINTTKLPATIPVFRGYPEELICEAEGYPPPKIQWLYSTDKVPHVSANTLIVSEAGFYNCTATNEVDSISREVKVILKEDYLPLIAGFVAVTVVAISIIFLFIYSIYYKNTRMRRYSLKNPKLNTYNGNVAHNGWDLQFPMTELSYYCSTLQSVKVKNRHVSTKDTGVEISLSTGPFFIFSFSESVAGWHTGETSMWFFIFSGLIACTGKPVSSSCPVEMSPPRVVVRFGDSFSVNCSSLSNQTVGMGWESSHGGTGLRNGATFLILNVNSLQDWAIDPQCYTSLDSGQCLKTLPVTVYKTPDSVSMSHLSQMGPMVEGKKYHMQCDIVNVAPVSNLSVNWHKGNKLFYTETFDEPSRFPINKSSVLNMIAHRDDNGIHIWCEAKLNFWPTVPNLPTIQSKSREMTVLYPPTFTEPANETLELPARGKMILNCTATGNPMPVYSWHFPHPIQQTKKNQNENQPILTQSVPLPGTYNCTVTNTQGTKTKYFIVIEAKSNRTTFAALVGGFGCLAVLLCIGGHFFVTPEGTFSFSKGGYLRGRPTSSGPTLHYSNYLIALNTAMWGPFCSNIVPCRVAKLVQVGISFLSPLNRRLSKKNMGNNFLQWILTLCMFYSVSGEGCSLILKPSRVVVGFGESVSVSCEAARPVRVLGWESAISAAHTQQDLSVQWKVDSLIDWIEEPICYGVFFTAPRQCEEKLNLVLYKIPDSVSIRPVNHTGPMVEGKEYQLLCEVQNIAPVQYLTLRWYRGQTEVYNHSFSDLTSSSPVQVSSILLITPTKAENGAQYRCAAVLELGPEGPHPPPTVTSEPLNASVYFPPAFLSPEPEVLDLIVGSEMTLNCTATGNPTPVYSWQSSHPIQERMKDEAVLTSSSLLPGTYTCTASNTLEKKSKQFIVKPKTKGV